MTPELEAKLAACPTLPSPPIVAMHILALARDPDIEIEELVNVISTDPALASKILRMANSPLYGQQKEVESLS